MNSTTAKTESFALTPGVLKIALGRLSRDRAEAVGQVAGTTVGGCTLRYDYKESELYDTAGRAVSRLRYGRRVSVTGELCTLSAPAMELLRRGDEVTALLTCPLPDGDSICINMKGAFPSVDKIEFKAGGRLFFKIVTTDEGCEGTLRLSEEKIGEEAVA